MKYIIWDLTYSKIREEAFKGKNKDLSAKLNGNFFYFDAL